MKKLIALLLAAIMVLSLAAGASSPAADQPANDQTTADTTTEETKTEEKTEEKTEDTAASGDVEVVTYYCSIGAYLNTLQAEVANWNETTGKEKGVEIQIISDINDYSNNARALMQGGTFYDLVDAGTGSADWIVSGWIQDLNTIDNAELKELRALHPERHQHPAGHFGRSSPGSCPHQVCCQPRPVREERPRAAEDLGRRL